MPCSECNEAGRLPINFQMLAALKDGVAEPYEHVALATLVSFAEDMFPGVNAEDFGVWPADVGELVVSVCDEATHDVIGSPLMFGNRNFSICFRLRSDIPRFWQHHTPL